VSISAADSCDWCAFACASAPICQLATDAIDGDEARVRKASLEEVAEALDTLESCRRHDCSWHGDATDARRLLQSIVDADSQVDL
jgi:hypothetical protein